MHFSNLSWLTVAIITSQNTVVAAPPFRPYGSSRDRPNNRVSSITTTKSALWPPSSTAPSLSTSGSSATNSSLSGSSPSGPVPVGSATVLHVQSSAPINAPHVPGDFVGFGFETAFLNNYAVGTFSQNLINSVAKRLSSPVIIRIGGTSGDILLIDPNQDEVKVCIDGDCPVGSSATYILGPSYFEEFRRFQNQHFTFQAPMGPDVNTTGSLAYVRRAYEAIGADRVAGIALGNEVDLYAGQFGTTYTVADYIYDALALEDAITYPTTFEFLKSYLSGGGDASTGFTVETAFSAGLNTNGRTKYAALHWYQFPTSVEVYTPETEQIYLMNHSAVTSKFSNGYTSALSYIQSAEPEVDYILSESGSSLIGPPLEFQDAFGAALWYVDFECYAMSLGVKREDATHRPAAYHSLWVPDDSTNDPALGDQQNTGPQVRGPWFAMPMIADFVGKQPGAVVPILEQDLATAYAMYDPSTSALSRIMLVNLKFWSADVNGERVNITFDVPVSGSGQVTVKRLCADAGAHAQGYDVQGENGVITWAGETWSYELDNGSGSLADGVPVSETVEVCNSVASITLPDSEAAIVYFGGGAQ
ncbi:hypothetical protein LTR37_000866 [Vermiconidia calcicola]|uniref:Uncharacterized protein n=1 Tax=Vermiconidia calcicola TaxID=1690605 RepID=A0ACC3NYJ2_9PEZI|nr:hypothetical protein LTR37_000866 [Vermiconidia calcicola]